MDLIKHMERSIKANITDIKFEYSFQHIKKAHRLWETMYDRYTTTIDLCSPKEYDEINKIFNELTMKLSNEIVFDITDYGKRKWELDNGYTTMELINDFYKGKHNPFLEED